MNVEELGIGEIGLTIESLYLLTWREFNLKCYGLLTKYQRLAVQVRQLAAVIINTTPGIDEPVQPEEIFLTAFDDIKPPPKIEYTADEWEAEQERVNKLFEQLEK